MMGQQNSRLELLKLPWLKLLISLGALVLLVVRFIWFGHQLDGITLGLFVIAVLPWFSELIQSLEFGGLKIQFRDIQARQEQQQSDIKTLQFLVTHLLTEDQVNHLTQLDKSTPYIIKQPVSPELQPDLRHLRGLGFIEQKSPGKTVAALAKELGNKGEVAASDSFRITDIGRTYLKLRE